MAEKLTAKDIGEFADEYYGNEELEATFELMREQDAAYKHYGDNILRGVNPYTGTNEKPIVFYREYNNVPPQVGHSCHVIPLNHTSFLVDNGYKATTSQVVRVNSDAQGNIVGFETLNTHYVLTTEFSV